MKVVITSDSFKGSASAKEISEFIEKGVRNILPSAHTIKVPLADGGEGTVDAIITATQGENIYKEVTDPLGRKIKAKFGLINKEVAVIEMAEASGLTLLKEEERNPFKTTTYGTGELILAALDQGVKDIYIGVGGSATNDGGAGMAQALGASLKDKKGKEIGFGALALNNLDTIDITNIDSRIYNTKITVLSDVVNPLCGHNGASYIYGPQKGGKGDDLKKLDEILSYYGEKLESEFEMNLTNKNGAGAGGGIGAGLMAFCSADLCSGIDRLLEIINFESYLEDIDLIITGEGKMDIQSLNGKAPLGIAKLAHQYNIPVVAIVGSEGEQIKNIYNNGIDLILSIVDKPMSIEEAMNNVASLTEKAAEKVVRAFLLGRTKQEII